MAGATTSCRSTFTSSFLGTRLHVSEREREREIRRTHAARVRRMPCAIVAVESSDMSGAVQIDIAHDIEKVAIDLDGNVLKASMIETVRAASSTSQTIASADVRLRVCAQMGGALTNHTDLHEPSERCVRELTGDEWTLALNTRALSGSQTCVWELLQRWQRRTGTTSRCFYHYLARSGLTHARDCALALFAVLQHVRRSESCVREQELADAESPHGRAGRFDCVLRCC